MFRWLTVTACLTFLIVFLGRPVDLFAQFTATWASQSAPMNGQADPDFWEKANEERIRMRGGWLLLQNDANYLYILVDLVRDVRNDRPDRSNPGDYFSLTFDINRDGRITPRTDISLGMYRGSYRLGKQYYLGPGRWTGLQSTRAKVAPGFGRSMNSRRPHRIWEIAIPLKELEAKAGDDIRFGINVHSKNPDFEFSYPGIHTANFSNLKSVKLHSLILQLPEFPVELHRVDTDTMEQAEQDTLDSPTVINRTILEDGAVQLEYSDGTLERLYEGGFAIKKPGQPWQKYSFYTNVQQDDPPALPANNQPLSDWLDSYNEQLLGVIRKLVANNEQAVKYYLEKETENTGSVLERMYYRLTYINRLTSN